MRSTYAIPISSHSAFSSSIGSLTTVKNNLQVGYENDINPA